MGIALQGSAIREHELAQPLQGWAAGRQAGQERAHHLVRLLAEDGVVQVGEVVAPCR